MNSALETAAPPKAMPLEIVGLVKRFGQVTAVDGVSIELQPGECLGLLGPNGAGKSTLIRSIVGRVIPNAGSVAIFGFSSGSDEARMALGWVPQDLAVYPRLTSKENLLSFGRYFGLSGQKLTAAVKWCLEWAALEDRANDLVKNLSGGMKRRLNMAAGIIHRPKIVLFDEPTVGVDPQSRNRIFEMIEALKADGTAIIYTTHYMEEAERLCDRIAIIDHGKVIASGTRDELVRDSFQSRGLVIARFADDPVKVEAWVEKQGGRMTESNAELTIGHSTEIAGLLESAASAGLELVDVTLRHPNLESVFLHLTGRGLRE